MELVVNNKHIFYDQVGRGSRDVVLLHGWGQNMEMMRPLANKIEGDYKFTIIDLPGFGSSSEPDNELDIFEYTGLIEKFLQELKITNPIIIGHSFGGRIAIIYASRNKTEKVVLFGAPCIREYKPTFKEKVLKALKKIPFTKDLVEVAKQYIGSTDYKNASPVMRKLLVNTINQDLSDCAKKITAPTLLIWGTLDTAAPIELARKLVPELKDGAIIEIPGATHYAYLERIDYVSNVLEIFLGGSKNVENNN
ncbi:MAG: alpha/beta hydrolase [bacterium]|mgnify:CR=1 FL=1|nr:alpha/beta hydrolase [bacterium]